MSRAATPEQRPKVGEAAPVLFIGGMDSSGGAGLLRDAATALALQAPYRVAVTAVTAQDESQVSAIFPVPPNVLEAQILLGLRDGAAVAKTGMLASTGLVGAAARVLPPGLPLIIDPVLRSSSGRTLLPFDGVDALLALLVPRAALLTPNLPELATLAARLGIAGADEPTTVQALMRRGCAAVLVKGGHRDDPSHSEDRLYRPGRPTVHFRAPRLPGNRRGTGCQLASGIAVALARGADLERAIEAGKDSVTRRFREAG